MNVEYHVTQAQNGDEQAFAEIYNTYVNKIYYFALQHVGSVQDAEDIVQNTFIEVFRSIRSLSEPGAFKTWLYRIAERQVVKFCRKQGRTPKTADEDISDTADTLEDDGGLLPESILDSKEIKDAVLGLISALPEAQKTAVLLYYYEEMGVKDIALIQDCSEGTVKSRLNYARKAMKAKIEDSRKKGAPIVAVVPLPLLTRLLREAAEQNTLPPETAQAILTSASGAAAVTVGAAAVKTGMTVLTKAVIGAAAAVVVTTGIIVGTTLLSTPETPIPDIVSAEPSQGVQEEQSPPVQTSSVQDPVPMPVTDSDYARLYYQYIQDVLIPSGMFIDCDMLDVDGDGKPELITSELTQEGRLAGEDGVMFSDVTLRLYSIKKADIGATVNFIKSSLPNNEGLAPGRVSRITFVGQLNGEKCLLEYFESIRGEEETFTEYAIFKEAYPNGMELVAAASSFDEESKTVLQSYINPQSTWAAVYFGSAPFSIENTGGERLKNYFDD